jgi:hypothetical protein
MAVVVALKVAAVAAAATVTDAGTVSVGLVLERVTVAPPAGAAVLRVTVQVLDALGPRLVGAQASAETVTGATRLIEEVRKTPLREAVKVAVWSEESVPAVAVKVALEELSGIVTLAGTGKAGTLELNPTMTELPVVAALRLTVQVVISPEDREVGAHPTEVRVTGAATEMLPPVAETAIG